MNLIKIVLLAVMGIGIASFSFAADAVVANAMPRTVNPPAIAVAHNARRTEVRMCCSLTESEWVAASRATESPNTMPNTRPSSINGTRAIAALPVPTPAANNPQLLASWFETHWNMPTASVQLSSETSTILLMM